MSSLPRGRTLKWIDMTASTEGTRDTERRLWEEGSPPPPLLASLLILHQFSIALRLGFVTLVKVEY